MNAQEGGQNPQQMQNPRFAAGEIQNQTNWNTQTRAGWTKNQRGGQLGQRQQKWHNNNQGAVQQQPNAVPFGNVRNNQREFQQQPNGVPFGNVHPLPTTFSYYHTHGYAVSAQYNSSTCKDQAPVHQW